MDNNLDIIQKALEVESIIEIGQTISKELELVYNILRSNFDDYDLFNDSSNYNKSPLDKDILLYLENTIKESENNIFKFEKELEEISNYNSDDDILLLNSKVIKKLLSVKNINFYLRFELEEYIKKIENVRNIIEEITFNLNKQKTDRLLGSKMIM